MTDTELDRRLGIRTSLTDYTWRGDVHPCQPSPMEALEAVAAYLTEDDTVADLGCGAGRAVFALTLLSGCRVLGIETDTARFRVAEENLRRCGVRAPEVAARIRLENLPAQSAVFTGVTACYAFNPFPARVLRGVLRNAAPARFFCYYPDDGWADVLAEHGYVRFDSIRLRDLKDPRERVDCFEYGFSVSSVDRM